MRYTPGGGCGFFGVGAPDSGTIATYLQKLLNEKCPEEGFAVFNYGYYLWDPKNCRPCDTGNIIEFLPTKPGDIIITEFEYGMNDYIDFSNIERPYKYGDIFFDNIHLTEAGYHEAADLIFDRLKSNNFYPKQTAEKPPLAKTPRRDTLNLKPDEAAQLKTYTDMLDNVAGLLHIEPNDNIGAIVMNCNPFTNGHRYLIETAAAQVKFLFVFAVQEDRSEFPFEERYELMQAATEDIENVYVLPSGNFIISSFTFSEYFNKKSLNTMAVNPSNDIRLFGGQLAPHLFIKTRFAGEEPLDPVTRQYNRQMEAILPQYGIAFEEIPRKETDGNVISASRVRELLKIRDFEGIEKLVPRVTLEYLENKYKDEITGL